MILRAAITFVALLFADMAAGQGVAVQSGDHDGFTRLVARIGEARDWQVSREGRSLHIDFTPDAPVFDLSGVFTLITRDRVASIRSSDGLTIELGCDCTVSLTRFQGRYAVIDISDTAYTPPDADPVAIVDLPDTTQPTVLPLPADLVQPAEQEPATAATAPSFDLEEAAAIMAEQLARAAAAGLLDAAPAQPLSMADPSPQDDVGFPDTPTPELAPTAPETHQTAAAEDHHQPAQAPPPILATNAFDLNQGIWPDRLIASAPTSCMAPPARPIADWPGDLSFINGLGGLRSRLFDDRGSLVDSSALDLVELYLVHGFGAEALFWLDESGADAPFHRAMAAFMEHGIDGQFGQFADHEVCPEALALWLFLTDLNTTRPGSEIRATILAQFFDIPAALRDIIGPDLARAFLRANDPGAAMEVRETLARGGRLSPQDLAFLDAELPDAPLPPVSALVPANAGSTRADPALTFRLFSQIRHEGAALPADLTAADALIRETQPPLVVDGLRHAAALGHALAGDVDAVLSHLTLNGQRDAEAIGPVFANILTALMDSERSAPLLLLLSADDFGQFGYFPNPAFRRRVARYLLDHGLPDMARDLILAGGSDHARDREVLGLAYDRLARDHGSEDTPPLTPQPPQPPQPSVGNPRAESPEAMAALLADTRALRQQAMVLLNASSASR